MYELFDQEPEKLLPYLFEQLPMGTAVIDRNFRLIRCNPTWAEFIERYTPSTTGDVVPGVSLFDLEPGTEEVIKPLFAPVFARQMVRREGIRLESGGIVSYWDVVLVPLEINGEVVAALGVSLDVTGQMQVTQQLQETLAALQESEANLRRNMAAQKQAQETLAQINVDLEQRVQERTQEIEQRQAVAESLRDILRVLNSSRPLPEILNYIVFQASQLMEAAICTLHHIDYRQAFVHIEASYGLPESLQDITGFPLLSSHADERILNREPVVISNESPPVLAPTVDDNLDPRVRCWRATLVAAYPAYLAVPLVVANQVYGSLAFYFATPRSFSQETIDLAMALGEQAALAIDNARLRMQAEEVAVASERTRLARELHDAVTQTLFSASLIADVLPRIWQRSPEMGQAKLLELRELTRGALAEMRTLLLELRPATLAESRLDELLQQLAVVVIGRSRLQVTVTVEGEEQRPLPPDIQVALYRIAQEALNNVVKHAGARQVVVTLRFLPDCVVLSITDDGRGFDPTVTSVSSLGLGIMRERAARIGAALSVESVIGAGTTIQVEACE
ncbi:MAG: GAF domain-containing protein [Anaerolineae bacterium]|nr:GAF domain-containing protein [Anaerolineae bacterium]